MRKGENRVKRMLAGILMALMLFFAPGGRADNRSLPVPKPQDVAVHDPSIIRGDDGFWYIFCSHISLQPGDGVLLSLPLLWRAGFDGGYNIRVCRSRQPDGPYEDALGQDIIISSRCFPPRWATR